MKPCLRPFPLILTLWVASTARVWAHPGHDDGHELTWDFDHLVAHPWATVGCLAVLAAAGWGVWHLLTRRSAPAPVRK